MRIISKFKDYYDGSVGAYGQDPAIIYKRVSKYVESHEFGKMFSGCNLTKSFKGVHSNNFFIIGFCGKFYPGWMMDSWFEKYPKVKYEICYDESVAFEKANMSEYRIRHDKSKLEEIRNAKNDAVFMEIGAPYFIWIPSEKWAKRDFQINPNLKDFGFQKIFNNYQAYQEISMYLSNILVLSNQKQPVGVSDKHRMESKGFDNWSFRNPEPPKRKRK